MPEIPEEFKTLLPAHTAEVEETWKGPIYLLWVFDPMTDEVTVDHNKGRHRAKTVTHQDMAPEVVHPGRLQGYAYRIAGGWRLTTEDHKILDDPHIVKRVMAAIRKDFPSKSLPNVTAAIGWENLDQISPMWHLAPQTARPQIEAQGLIPKAGGGFGSGQSPLVYPSAVYLTSHPGHIGLRDHAPFESLGGSHDIWEVNTERLPLRPDWPSVVEHGAYTEGPGLFYFEEGDNPEGDVLHDRFGPVLRTEDFDHNPLPMINLTGTAAHHGPISPERLRRVELAEWLKRYGPSAH